MPSDLVDGIWDSYKRGRLLDLRLQADASTHPKLREIDARRTAEIIIGRLVEPIGKCQACKREANSKVKLCQFHWHRIQKLYFIFQEVHGFAADDPFPVSVKEHGPYLEGLDEILSSRTTLESWEGSKETASSLGFGPIENRIIHSMITIYNQLNYNNIELLAARLYRDQHPESASKLGISLTYEIVSQPKLMDFEQILESIETTKPLKVAIPNTSGLVESKYPSIEEWESEKDAVKSAIASLEEKLRTDLEFSGALPVGSSGILLLSKDKNLHSLDGTNLLSVLKFPRPRGGTFRPANLQTLSEEISKMSSVIHPNIVRVLRAGDVTVGSGTRLPWFTMEYVEGAQNLREFVQGMPGRDTLLKVLIEIATALDYIHSKGIIHCDIKDENILVRVADPPQGLLTDLGYAHVKVDDDKEILVRFTDRTAHPFLKRSKTRESDPAAATAKILRRELSADFDLYAFGKTLLDLLPEMERDEIFDSFDLKYLNLVILRLLRGHSADRPLLHGITETITKEIQYRDSRQLLEDLLRFGI